MKKHFKILTSWLLTFLMILTILGPVSVSADSNTVEIQILATSDLHGKFQAYDYATNSVSKSGSLAQISTAIKKFKAQNPNTLIVDNGDTIQGNSVQIFNNEDSHPMITAMNEIGYDTWTFGNHEFNYGVPTLEKIAKQFKGTVLGGNVYRPDGTRLGAPYAIIERGGVKIGIVGMVTPHITKWDAENLKGYKVTSPIEETRKAVDEIKDKVDVIIAVEHMGPTPEYGDDGADLLANKVPELAAIVAGHAHMKVPKKEVNGVIIVEPANAGTQLARITIKLTKDAKGKYKIANKASDVNSELIDMATYEEDQELLAKLKPFHDKALADANTIIGKLVGGDLAPANEINGIPQAQLQPTAMIELINKVQMHYTKADVSAAALFNAKSNIKEGDIKKSDSSLIYQYDNTLYMLEVTGKQLKKYMEWSANYYNTFKPGDLTISFNPNIRMYNYDMFYGVKYEIDISQPEGSRIKNLRYMNDVPVKDDDIIKLAVNNYRANTTLLNKDTGLFKGEDVKVLFNSDLDFKEAPQVRDMIAKYIKEVKGGVISPECSYNWKLTGYSWDYGKHSKVVEMINSGLMSLPTSADGRTPNVKSITWDMVPDIKNTINVLSFNDFHGTLKFEGKNPGAAKFAGFVKKYIKENPNSVVVSAGDIYQGSAMSNLLLGKPVSEMLKSIGIAASAVGNHEFDWGANNFETWSKEGGFEFLAANIYDKKTGKPVSWAKPYKYVTINGKKIAFIGIATPETLYKTKPENVKDYDFKDPYQIALPLAYELKMGMVPEGRADIVIALTHLGSDVDASKNIIGEFEPLTKISYIDAIITGHLHKSVSGYLNGKPVVQAYYNGRTLGRLALEFNYDGKFIGARPSLINVPITGSEVVEDAEVKAMYEKYENQLKPILEVVVGKTTVELPHDRFAGPSLLGEWVSDVMRKRAGVQIGITNGGGLRTSIPAGDITMGKMYEVMPFDNTLVKMELTGADLKKVLENGIMNQTIGWVQVAGVKVYYNPKANAGERITSMRLNDGTKVEMDKYYTVVTNDFMFTGGDNYDFKGAKNAVDTNIPIRDALVEELKNVKTISPVKVGYLIEGEDPVKDTNNNNSNPQVKKFVTVTASSLYVRSSYKKEARAIGSLKRGTKVEVVGQVGNWLKIKYKGKDGYIYKAYTK
ncbi:Trifunctional nucleotide phosphoesterase protein YfkN precursor [Caloramator mitchellensis]|uniref:Trifunctional nucleotide phosphoesterase protein YfkN n=1 Tax=Caloramator mitchellensis TaxID=908809 RepID=A0A0R3JVR2_CALMK|nr:5'-nucleotidase C-terminal domain-containing protein [Caloramator mitchellensis]KRQ87670.1 Trifunctional nucleotide phosphoesterase protein YfkN precursor [Caloramator mitchellensis]